VPGNDVRVRPERPTDAEHIRRVHDAAFGGLTEGRIVDDLRCTPQGIEGGSLVAEDPGDGRVVGHLLISRGTLERRDRSSRDIWAVGPVGVLPERQGEGIGAALMHAAIALATRRAQPLLCLVGHAGYYPRFGFEPARAIGLDAPSAWPDANWQALRLPAWMPDLRGRVRFPPAFPEE
jgi:putative acetyltransferase